MNKNEILGEISLIKRKLTDDMLGLIQRTELLVALLSLYDSYIKLVEDKNNIEDSERNKAA